MTLCLFLFKVSYNISTKYLDAPYGTASIVDTLVLIRQFFPDYELL